MVYEAKLKESSNDIISTTVAVKTLGGTCEDYT